MLLGLVLATSACSSADPISGEGEVPEAPAAPPETHATPVDEPAAIDRAGVATPAIAHQRERVTPVMVAGFEPASAACNDWEAEGADAIRSVPPRSGEYACKLCATGNSPEIAIARAGGALEPGRYVLSAWLRTRPDKAAPDGVVAELEATTVTGPIKAQAPLVLAPDYSRVTVTLDLAEPASSIRARIGAPAIKGQCVLIDDVLVERVP